MTRGQGRRLSVLVGRLTSALVRNGHPSAAVAVGGLGKRMRVASPFDYGNVLYRTGNYSLSIEHLTRALELDPSSGLASSRLSTAALKTSDVRQIRLAASALQAAAIPRPSDLYRLARGLETLTSYADALELYEHAWHSWFSPEAHERIVLNAIESGEKQWRIIDLLYQGADLHLADDRWILNFAKRLSANGRYAEAAEQYAAIIPGLDAQNLYDAAWCNARAGFHKQSDRLLRSALAKLPERERRLGSGYFHEQKQRWLEAAHEYEKAAVETPDRVLRLEVLHRAAYSHEAALNFEKAAMLYGRAADLDPESSERRFREGVARELGEDFQGALLAYQHAATIAGTFEPEIQFRIGFVAHKTGRHEEAIRALLSFAAGRMLTAEFSSPAEHELSAEEQTARGRSPRWRLTGDAHLSWARQHFESKSYRHAAAHYRRAFITDGLRKRDLNNWAIAVLLTEGATAACRTVIEWRNEPMPAPLKMARPPRFSIEGRNSRYAEFRQNLQVTDDVILYEASLGLAVDCNPLAICRQAIQEHPGRYIHVWSVEDGVVLPPDLEECIDVVAVRRGSDHELRMLATAGYIVNNSTFPTHPVLRPTQRYLNTWHGTPLKAMAKDTPEVFDYANIARNFLQATALIHPNWHTRRVMIEGTDVHNLARAEIRVSGYPRNDALVGAVVRSPRAQGEPRRVLIAPTWRPEEQLETEIQKIASIATALSSLNVEVVVRAHHYIEARLLGLGLPLQVVPRSTPTNDLLPTVDVLVTDYSSIFFDFALTRRPIVFFVPDWEEYSRERGLYLGREDLPGVVCETVMEVVEAVAGASPHPKIESFIREYSGADDGRAAHRALDLLFHGPTFGELCSREPANDSVFLRGELLENGITSALSALAHELSISGMAITIGTDVAPVRRDPVRQVGMERLSRSAAVIGRVGAMVATRLQWHAMHVAKKNNGEPTSEIAAMLIEQAFDVEWLRLFGSASFAAAVEYEGYSEFWADLVLAAGRRGSRTSIYMHNDIVAEIQMKFPWLARVARRYHAFGSAISVSPELAATNEARLRAECGVDELTVRSARNVVDVSTIAKLAQRELDDDIRQFIGEDGLMVLAVGRLSPEKNHKFLLRVAGAVMTQVPRFRLVVCGRGPLSGELRREVEALGLTEHVFFAGQRALVYPIMSRAECLVLPSLHEGQPVVLLEAAALGVPVLASKIDGNRAFEELGAELLDLDEEPWASRISSHLLGRSKIAGGSGGLLEYVPLAVREFLSCTGFESRPPSSTSVKG